MPDRSTNLPARGFKNLTVAVVLLKCGRVVARSVWHRRGGRESGNWVVEGGVSHRSDLPLGCPIQMENSLPPIPILEIESVTRRNRTDVAKQVQCTTDHKDSRFAGSSLPPTYHLYRCIQIRDPPIC